MKLCAITAINDSIEDIEETYQSLHSVLSKDFTWVIKYYKNSAPSKLENIQKRSIFIKLICRQDNSLYEGLNQAIDEIQSEYFFVLGSGDKINPTILLGVVDLLKTKSPDGLFLSTFHLGFSFLIKPNPTNIMDRMSCPHPSSILKTSLVKELGKFNTRYLIASDYDLLSRFILNFNDLIVADDLLVYFKGGGMSETKVTEAFCEELLIRSRIWNKNTSQQINNMAEFINIIKPQL